MKKLLSVCLVAMFSAKLAAAEIPMPKKLKSKKPNIVFFLTDDHRYDALGFMGHPLS